MIRNTCIKDENGKEYYSGRYGVAVGIVIAREAGEIYILANQRGTGAPSHKFEWNLPVGFIEYGESGEQAASREVYEETTITIPPIYFKFNSAWCPANQNTIALRYIAEIKVRYTISKEAINHTGGEPNEVSAVAWINIKDLNKYKWCYEHDKLINELFLSSK